MTPKTEIEALKSKARDIEARLSSLRTRIREVEQNFSASALVAIVDAEECTGCGTCEEICPTGAIAINGIARVDPKWCTGCSLCVQQCLQEAIELRPVDTSYREQARGVS